MSKFKGNIIVNDKGITVLEEKYTPLHKHNSEKHVHINK